MKQNGTQTWNHRYWYDTWAIMVHMNACNKRTLGVAVVFESHHDHHAHCGSILANIKGTIVKRSTESSGSRSQSWSKFVYTPVHILESKDLTPIRHTLSTWTWIINFKPDDGNTYENSKARHCVWRRSRRNNSTRASIAEEMILFVNMKPEWMNGLFGSIGHEETEWDPCHCQLWSTTGMHEQIVRGANQANETGCSCSP